MNDLLSESQRFVVEPKAIALKQSPHTPPVDTLIVNPPADDDYLESSESTPKPSTSTSPPVANEPSMDAFSFGDKKEEEQEQ